MIKIEVGDLLKNPSTPSEAIVLEVASRTGMDPFDLPPLYQYVDPEALDRLVLGPGSCRATFEYAGYGVTVHETNHIALRELGSDRAEDD